MGRRIRMAEKAETAVLRLEGGGSVSVEVATSMDGTEQVGRLRQRVNPTESLESILDKAAPAVTVLLDRFRGMGRPGDHITVEFGMSFTAGLELAVARTSSEANFKVTFETEARETAAAAEGADQMTSIKPTDGS